MTAPGHAGGEPGLAVERVEVVPSAGGLLHVRVIGAWHGRLLSAPRAVLLAGTDAEQARVEPIHEPREPVGGWVGPRGEWRATFPVPERLLAGGASLEIDGRVVALPGLHPPGEVSEPDTGAAPPQPGATILDHPALAEARSRGEAPEARMPPPSRRATIAGREAMLARELSGGGSAHVAPARTEAPAPSHVTPGRERPGDREESDRVAALRAQVAAAVHGVASDLEAERAARAALEGELVRERDRRAALEAELARRRVVDARLAAGVAAARGALAQATAALTQAPAGPSPAVRERMDELRAQVEALRDRASGEPPAPSASVDPERLGAALARLRATVAPALEAVAGDDAPVVEAPAVEAPAVEAPAVEAPAVEAPAVEAPAVEAPAEDVPAAPAPAEPVAAWLPAALREIAARDPEAAGRAIVALLPAQGIAVPGELTYDLALRRGPAYSVTVRDGATEVLERSSPRRRRERDFAARASLRGLGAWSTGRRRRGVRGRRRAGPLRALAAHPFSLAELDAAGVRPDAELAWLLVAAAVDPRWTEGHELSVRHEVIGLERPAAVIVRAGAGAPLGVETAAGAGDGTFDATLRTTPGAVLAALRGAAPPRGEMIEEGGDRDAIATLQEWIARAQRGIRPYA